ncbi:hypothetical protein GQR58_013523 [Nymphon striatum]|nr:hypothetical protein GQR58_013523 [Nymphon striatum]
MSASNIQIGNWKFEVGRVFNLPNAIKKSGEIWQHRVFKLAKASPSCEGIIEVMDFEAGGKLKRKEKDCYKRVCTVLENWVFLEKYLNFEISPLGLGLNVPCVL